MVSDLTHKTNTEAYGAQMNTKLNVEQARGHFPALTNSDFILADNAGGSQVPKLVVDQIADYLLNSNVQLGASYSVCKRAAARVQAGVEAAKMFVNAAQSSEIVLGPSSTMVLQNLARALENDIKPTDEIIITNCDHEANIGPWVRLANKRNATLKIWKADMDRMELQLDALGKLLSPNTRLVAITHCSNILGNIIDVQKVAEMVHAIPGAEICVDGVAFAPHRLIDVQEWDVDYYVFSWYKVFGPHMALLYTNSRTMPRLSNLNHHFITANPAKLQPGGVNYEGTNALPGICIYLQSLSLPTSSALPQTLSRDLLSNTFHLIAEHEAKLCSVLLQYFLAHPETYTVFGRKSWKPEARVATVAFTVFGWRSQDVVQAIEAENDVPTCEEEKGKNTTSIKEAKRGIGMKWGNFHAHSFCEAYFGDKKADGVVRLSFVHYNTVDEVEYVVKALDRIVRKEANHSQS